MKISRVICIILLSIACGDAACAAVDLNKYNQVTSAFFDVNTGLRVGTNEFNAAVSERMRSVPDMDIVSWLMERSDRVDHEVRLRYLCKEITIILLDGSDDGLVVSRIVVRKDKEKRLVVVESVIRVVKGIYFPSEDIVPISELNNN